MSKSVVELKNNNKNKLNSEIILIFNLNPNAHLKSLNGEMVKRDGKHVFEDGGEDTRAKKRCTASGISQPLYDERSAMAAVQHRREQ